MTLKALSLLLIILAMFAGYCLIAYVNEKEEDPEVMAEGTYAWHFALGIFLWMVALFGFFFWASVAYLNH